jgi:hypothetical protein
MLPSVWHEIKQREEGFRNPFYREKEGVLRVEVVAHRLRIWQEVFLRRDPAVRDRAEVFSEVEYNWENRAAAEAMTLAKGVLMSRMG